MNEVHKKSAKYLFDLTDDQLYTSFGKTTQINWLSDKEKNQIITPRKILQLMGTDFVRNMIHPDFWVMWLEKEITEEIRNYEGNKNQIFIIDDCRFENEFKMIRKADGIIIHLTRENGQQKSDHESENVFWYKPGDHVLHMPNNVSLAKDIMTNFIDSLIKWEYEELL